MTHRTGAVILAALALSVAFLGIFLAVRCERAKRMAAPGLPAAETLVVGTGLEGE